MGGVCGLRCTDVDMVLEYLHSRLVMAVAEDFDTREKVIMFQCNVKKNEGE